MNVYLLQLQDHYQDQWGALGMALKVIAESPAAALDQLCPPGLNYGVKYRIHIRNTTTGQNYYSAPAIFPAMPVMPS